MSSGGSLVGAVEQPAEKTRFAFEPGCMLRMKIQQGKKERAEQSREAAMSDPKSTTNDRKTLVEEGTQFKGSLSSNCPIEVKGRIEGDLTAPALAVSRRAARCTAR